MVFTSAANYLNAATNWCRSKGIKEECLPTKDPTLMARMDGMKKMHAGEGLVRGPKIPISIDLLWAMVEWWRDQAATGKKSELLCRKQEMMLIVGFFGLMRGSEVVQLKIKDLTFVKHGVKVAILKSKGAWAQAVRKVKKGAWTMLASKTASGFEISKRLMEYCIMLEQNGFTRDDPLFPVWDVSEKKLTKKTMNKNSVAEVIRATLTGLADDFPVEMGDIDPKLYASHSLRRGGLNHGRRSGNSRFMAKLHGRWMSDAIEAYDEMQEDEMAAFTAVM
jgi:hypothetical protein